MTSRACQNAPGLAVSNGFCGEACAAEGVVTPRVCIVTLQALGLER